MIGCITEVPVPGKVLVKKVLVNAVTTFVQQSMMSRTQQHQVFFRGLAAIGPMHHVMRVQPFIMGTARKTTTFIASDEGALGDVAAKRK